MVCTIYETSYQSGYVFETKAKFYARTGNAQPLTGRLIEGLSSATLISETCLRLAPAFKSRGYIG